MPMQLIAAPALGGQVLSLTHTLSGSATLTNGRVVKSSVGKTSQPGFQPAVKAHTTLAVV
jgi:hypothetical protein